MKYGISFEFDAIGEPPKVFIAEDEGRGTQVVEVLEEPICITPAWSDEDDDWRPGLLAAQLLRLMNEYV